MRTDRYERFVSCLVYLPRDRFNTANRMRIGEILQRGARRRVGRLGAAADRVGAGAHPLHAAARAGRARATSTSAELEARIVEATRAWDDELQAVLIEEGGEEAGTALFRRYGAARSRPPTATTCIARSAIADVQRHRGAARATTRSTSRSTGRWRRAPGVLRCKLYRRGERVSLSDVLPMFESLGLTVTDERPYEVTPRDGAAGVDLRLRPAVAPGEVDADAIRERFHEGFARVWHGEAELDGFNGLIIGAGLDWREVTMLRAVARYLRQAGIPFSDRYMEQTLLGAHRRGARRSCELFHARFDPAGDRARRATPCVAEIEARDRRRRLARRGPHPARLPVASSQAMLRTNYYLPDRSRTCRSSSTRRRSR